MGFLQRVMPLAYPEVAEACSMGDAKAVADNSITRAKESKFLVLNRGILVLVSDILVPSFPTVSIVGHGISVP